MRITFDLEASDQDAAFFALYAGLRMYKEQKDRFVSGKIAVGAERSDAISIAAAEAYCMLQTLKENFPSRYRDAEKEYDMIYANPN